VIRLREVSGAAERGRSIEVAVASVVASTYAVLVVALSPISFLHVQVRVADALIPLSMLLGWPAIVGVAAGCLVANLFAPWQQPLLVAVDAALGSLANLAAGYASWRVYRLVRGRLGDGLALQVGCAVESAVVAAVVGTYLKYLLEASMGLRVPLLACVAGVLLGSLISINLLGYLVALALLGALSRRRGSAP